jgi:hypothetical protein
LVRHARALWTSHNALRLRRGAGDRSSRQSEGARGSKKKKKTNKKEKEDEKEKEEAAAVAVVVAVLVAISYGSCSCISVLFCKHKYEENYLYSVQ